MVALSSTSFKLGPAARKQQLPKLMALAGFVQEALQRSSMSVPPLRPMLIKSYLGRRHCKTIQDLGALNHGAFAQLKWEVASLFGNK